MSNTLDEKILKAIKTAYELALASAPTEEQKKGIDNFYHIHLNPLQFQIPTWTEQAIEAYIAEKQKELTQDLMNKAISFTANNDAGYFINSGLADVFDKKLDELELKSNERGKR